MYKALWPVTQQFNNKNGSILTSGKIYIYYQGRTALATTYHDEDGTVVNSNPVLLDNNGRATVFVNPIYSYTIVVCDYYGQELFSQDITSHDAIYVAKDLLVLGTDGTVLVDTENLQNVVKYDISVNTDKIATKKSVYDVKTDLTNLTEVVNNHTTEIGQIKDDVAGIESSLTNKKDKQSANTFTGSATKTVKTITQNANGEMHVEFEDINLPPEVPNVEISSEDNSVQITETTDTQTNTKKFDLSVNVDDKIPDPSTSNPLMDGTASVGSSIKYAREDHVHPTDTSRASASHTHGSITNDGKIGTTADLPVITSTGGAVTTGRFSTTASEVGTSSAAGTANTFSRGDHVHSISLNTGDSDGQVKIAGSNVSVAGWRNKASQFSLGSTASSRVYTMFARMSDENLYDDGEAQVILSSAGNYGITNQGTWEIIVSNRGSTASSPKAYMTVRCINAVQVKSGEVVEPTFGYYIDTTNHYIYFGIYSPPFRGNSRITVLVSSNTTLQDFGDSTTAPTGWTTVTPTGVSSAVKLDTARTIQTDLASTSSARFDGTANITPGVTGTLPVANGGTGATTPAGAQYKLIDKATTELGTMTDTSRNAIMTLSPSYTNSVFAGYLTGLTMWKYMKGKMSSDTGVNISGKAATARTADKAVADNSGNNIEETYTTKTELYAAIDTVNAKGLTVKEISGEQVICFE